MREKNDYYGVLLCLSTVGEEHFNIFPGMGFGTLGALVSLHKGWGLKVNVLFDADRGGRDGRKKLNKDLSLRNEELHKLSDFSPNIKCIEDVFSSVDVNELTDGDGTNKVKLNRRVQEILAAEEQVEFDEETLENMRAVLAGVAEVLG